MPTAIKMKVMNTEDVQEGNKLIAEFMGYKRNDGYSGDFARLKHWNIEPFGWHDDEQLKYHSSWDWIMPVVAKIMFTSWNMTDSLKQCFLVRESIDWIEVEKTWLAVVDFIKWYNQQSK
jgi:hypothetical protein